jgi:hypothetical protein
MLAVDPDLPYMVVAHVALHKRDARTFLGGVKRAVRGFLSEAVGIFTAQS